MNEHIKYSLELYVNRRTMTGGFLHAVLCNDLTNAFARADVDNARNMHEIVKYVYNEIPAECWGSKERVNEWLNGK